MFNVMLDRLPDDYQGYKIRTDYEIGIQIMMALEDDELTEQEQIETAFALLYIDVPDTFDTAYEGLNWFLSSWNNDHHKKTQGNETPVMDLDIDQWRIYAAFRQQYRINLNTDKLHYWEFMALLSNLDECAFTRVINIRSKKITAKMSSQEKSEINKAKQIYAIRKESEPEYTAEEQERIDTFMKYVNIE